MSIFHQSFGISAKLIGICLLVSWSGVATTAVAADTLGLPALPTLPTVPEPTKAPTPEDKVNQSGTKTVAAPTAPEPAAPAAPSAEVATTGVPPLPSLPALPNEAPATTTPKPADDSAAFGKPAATTPPTVPGIEVPAVPGASTSDVPPPLVPPELATTPLPTAEANAKEKEVHMSIFGNRTEEPTAPAPKKQTWKTRLAPTAKVPALYFNYKRTLLPETIYRDEYSRVNRHLPPRMTREQYAALLFDSVARRDMEATRALLNAGVSPAVRNAYGETPIAFAERMGAMDIAALLNARGRR